MLSNRNFNNLNITTTVSTDRYVIEFSTPAPRRKGITRRLNYEELEKKLVELNNELRLLFDDRDELMILIDAVESGQAKNISCDKLFRHLATILEEINSLQKRCENVLHALYPMREERERIKEEEQRRREMMERWERKRREYREREENKRLEQIQKNQAWCAKRRAAQERDRKASILAAEQCYYESISEQPPLSRAEMEFIYYQKLDRGPNNSKRRLKPCWDRRRFEKPPWRRW